MDLKLSHNFKELASAQEAAEIVRKCVHCGFCIATCPTYQLLGDESDSPRGRIYLLKQFLEKGEAGVKTRMHLDQCLLCRSCETTCPSGVAYGNLLEIGRNLLDENLPRTKADKAMRLGMGKALTHPSIFKYGIKSAVLFRKVLPKSIKKQLPDVVEKRAWPRACHKRQMLVLKGCVQGALSPETNLKAAEVLDKMGISLLQESQPACCGAVGLHTSNPESGLAFVRRRIDDWWPFVEAGIEAVVFTASGCGVTIKDYGHLLKDDALYAEKAKQVSGLAKDISEVVLAEKTQLSDVGAQRRVVFHPPCTLQHGLKLGGVVEQILQLSGYTLLPFKDAHLCCGSAGTYSVFQPKIAKQLRENKLAALQADAPEIIATANIGCQQHLKAKADVHVVHWIQLL